MPRPKKSNQPGKPRNKRDDRPRGKHGRGSSRNDKSKSSKSGTFDIKVKAMANGGYALGLHNKRTTFVPYTIPGETVKVRLVETRSNVDFATGVEMLSASADRVFPQCPHFGPSRCWGCQWQHIDYKAQLLLKQDVLADQLYRIGNFQDRVIEKAMKAVKPSAQQWGYNSHMTFERNVDGHLGLPKVDGRSIQAIETCHILHPDLQTLYDIIEIDFDDMKKLALWRGSGGETMIIITMTSEDAPELTADLPTSVNVILPDNEPVNLVGDSMIYYEVGKRLFRVTAGGYFRANVAQIDNLIAEVLAMLYLSEDDSVLDLYAGVGVFSAFIAQHAGLVTLVESYPPTATDAEENLKDFDNIDIIEGSVESVLPSLIAAGERYEAAVIDPPSRGLSREVLESLVTLNIPKLAYISSDPASLARDAQALCKRGYTLKKVQPFDFAPQTYYIDAVALLEK
ncbi:MAG: rRNA adenine N-6-methyltransferase family protein [Anaerolineae bacterium]|nr:rRNA adenine N-6-methyltransferase family protein [Anaerolineae bacterium]